MSVRAGAGMLLEGGADLGPGAGLQVQAVQVIQAGGAVIAPKEPQAAAVFAGTQGSACPGTGRLHTAHATPTPPRAWSRLAFTPFHDFNTSPERISV